METLAKSDIFFVVTTFAILLVTIVVVIASVYIVKILNDIKYISKKIKDESDNISEDLSDLREHFKKGMKFAGLAGLFSSMVKRRRNKK